MLEHLDRMAAGASALGIALADPVLAQLSAHWDLVEAAGARMNLTRIRPADAWVDHVLDSLALLCDPWFPATGGLVDVGSGAGYPGLALAMARQQLEVTLLESNRKRAAFLVQAIDQLGLGERCQVIGQRAEEVARGPRRETFPALVARALAPLPVLLELTVPLVARGGVALLSGGPRMASALPACAAASRQLGGEATWVPVALEGRSRGWVRVNKHERTPSVFPRSYGLIRKRPLG